MTEQNDMLELTSHRVIKASKNLQLKAGTGDIDPESVKKAEKVIEQNTVDFQPIAQQFLDRLARGILLARAGEGSKEDLISGMVQPVMELKANARMFKYDLVTSLANIMMGFLESVRDLDSDAVEIVDAHHKTLSAIVIKKMTGDGGSNGQLLQMELQDACERYFKKRGITG